MRCGTWDSSSIGFWKKPISRYSQGSESQHLLPTAYCHHLPSAVWARGKHANPAKNARASVEMIELHYASTLNGVMNIGLLHSKRKRKSGRKKAPEGAIDYLHLTLNVRPCTAMFSSLLKTSYPLGQVLEADRSQSPHVL